MHWGERGDPTSVLPVRDSKRNGERESDGWMEGRGVTKAEPSEEDVKLVWPSPRGVPSSGLQVCSVQPTSPRGTSDPSDQRATALDPGLLEKHTGNRCPAPCGRCSVVRKGGHTPPPHPPQAAQLPGLPREADSHQAPFQEALALGSPPLSPRRAALQFSCPEEPRRARRPQG